MEQHVARDTGRREKAPQQATMRAAVTLIALAAMLGIVSACGSASTSNTPTSIPKAAASVRVAVVGDESTLTPYTYVSGYPGYNMLSMVYDSLITFDVHNQLRPLLATSWTSNADASVWTVQLRSGVTWQDGQAFTPADVEFTFQYTQQHAHSRWTAEGKSVTSLTNSGNTLTFHMSGPNPGFAITTLADMPMLPQHIWQSVTDPRQAPATDSMGTGPYKLVSYTPSQTYQFAANPHYFLGTPPVNLVTITEITDPTTVYNALRSGEIDATTVPLTPELVSSFESTSGMKVAEGAGFLSTLLQINDSKAPFTNQSLRQAIDYAVDKKQLVSLVLDGRGTVGSPGYLHPALPVADPSLTAHFDVSKARSLLDGIGAKLGPDGVRVLDGHPLAFSILAKSNDPLGTRAAGLIATDLNNVGFKITVTALDATTLTNDVWKNFDVTQPRNYDMAIFGWSPPVMLRADTLAGLTNSNPAIGTINIGGFRSAEADQMQATLDSTVNSAQRTTVTRQFEKVVSDQVPFVTLYYASGEYAYRTAAYSGWVYQVGQGTFQKLSFLPLNAR